MMSYTCDFCQTVIVPGNTRYEGTNASGAHMWDSCSNDIAAAVEKSIDSLLQTGRILISASIVHA